MPIPPRADRQYAKRCYKFPPRLVRLIQDEAARMQLPQSDIVRRALDAYFRDNPPPPTPR